MHASDPYPLSAVIVVAHPDDETLWAGGEILAHPDWEWFIISLCRASDVDRSVRFRRALEQLNATGCMADLDDGPEQAPLPSELIRQTILSLLPERPLNCIYTHGPEGEYTRHRRHEEVSRAVHEAWTGGQIITEQLRMFAYEDGQRSYYPRAIESAHIQRSLPEALWQRKHAIIVDVYGFSPGSWEAQTTPREEAFWSFDSPAGCAEWIRRKGNSNESARAV
ncbi:MAG: PIG-L family deacetylase [Phycisphaerales bacterium]|nr:PIG-L family deacetylase [Phycisphaerales bacterium]